MFFCPLRQFFLCLLLVLCFSLSTADSGHTQSPPLTFPPADKPAVTPRPLDSKKTVSFRRWLAPLDRIDDWPYGPGRYIQFNREQFEQWITQLTVPHDEPGTIVPDSKKSPFSEIVLRAEWEDGQLVRGTGSLRLRNCSVSPQEKTQKTRCCSFAPPGFWMDSPKLEDGTPVPLVCGADGTFKFILPVAENTVSDSKNCSIHFRWSLRSRLTSQQGTVFDFTLPPCPAAELQLTLPDSLIPSLSGGIVQEEPVPEQEIQEKNGTPVFKHWRIFFSRQSLSTLTVSSRKKVAAKQRQTGIRQTLVYNIAPQGTDIRSTFVFDKTETRISELSFDLDPSLRLIEILYGDQRVPWTPYFSDDYPSGAGIIVDLSNVSKNEQRELTLRAISTANEPFFRHLPRIRIVSDNVFWQETRCHIIVQNPYKVQAVNAPNAVRVSPSSSAERTDREVLTFQFFEADAAVSVMLADLSPKVFFDSAVQILLGNNDIQGTVTVDAGVTDGNCYVLSLPLSDAWTVDSVKSVYRLSDSVKTADGNEIAFWDITDSGKTTAEQTKPLHKQNVLSLQLKQPLLSKQTLRFRITGRCQMDTEKEHRLEEIVPLASEIQKKGTHLLAVQPLPPFHLQYRSPIPALPEVSGFSTRLSQNFGEPPLGTVIQLDAQSREIPFGITRLKPNYSAEITQTVTIQEKELILSCLFQCRPLDSSVDRIYVHFTGGHESFFQSQRFWSSGSDSIQSRVLSAEEQAEVLDLPDVTDGEMWEIRFASPQTSPFEINVTATVPLPEMFPVPLAAVPAASLQKGTITVESPHPGQYRILNTHTHIRSFPIAAPKNTHYQTVRGAFRYDPAERLPSALVLQRLRPEELPPAAWIWSLRLNSQYEPEGFVKNNAVFFLENQGKKHLRITLPDGITAAGVRTVRQNGQRISWYPEQKTQKHETIVIPMPEKIRFVSVSLEYSYQDTPLIRQRHLKPKYPSADVPILTKHWAVWFPPDFEVLFNGSNLRQTFDGTKSRQAAALNGSLLYPFLPGTWKQVLYGAKQRSEAENAVSVFFGQIEDKLIEDKLNESSREENSNERTNTPSENVPKEKTLVWADLFGKEKELSNAFNDLQEKGEKTAGAKIFIDKHALTMLGITPSSAVKTAGIKRGAELFEQSGLTVLLASKTAGRNKEYSFYITSALLCALHQRFHSLPLGNTSRYFPENENIPVYSAAKEPDSRFSAAFSPGKTPDWVPAAEWNAKTSFPAVQWSLSPQMIPFISAIPEWNCFEVPQNTESSVRLINRQIYTSYHYFAFLLAVVLTSSKRFSHPLLLIALLLFFGITLRYTTPCYAGISYGAFLGTLVSAGFGLIRSRTLSAPLIKASMPNRRVQPDSPTHIGNITSDLTSDGEKTARETNIGSSLLQTVLLLFLFLVLFPPSVSGQESAAEPTEWTKDKFFHPLNIGETEPYRVFFPVDKEQRITGNTVWIPMEFLQFLSQNVRNAGQNTPQDWNIERAEYQGTFVHRSQTQLLELSDDFKATYEIRLNTDNAVILLPPLPLRQDHVLWDARPVPVTQRTTKDGKYDALLLPIENETAGKHVLVLSLSPKQELLNDICRISLDIPKVPNTVLRLKTPQDAPPIRVAHSLGAVIPNSLEETTLTAQIGPSEKLAFSWNSEGAGNNSPFIEADQYFRLSARMTQVEMRVVFRLRIDSGKIRQLQIQTDPRWHRSGQFYCEDVPIDSVETSLNSENNNAGKGTNPGEVTEITRIVFQKPVSGTVTLEAGFVLHDFNGIGKIRLPQFKTLNAKINRSTLAVFSDSLLQLDYPKTGLSANWNTEKTEIPDDAAADTPRTSSSPFSNPRRSEKTGNGVAGSASAAETEMRAAEYDLLKTDSSWVLAVRTKKQIPVLTQYQSVLLDDGNVAVVCRNEFQITGEVSQQRFTVPKNLEIESVEALNTEKNPVEIRWGKMNKTAKPLEEYNVFFCRPISGKYSLIVRGHFPAKIKEQAEKKHPVPQLMFQDVFVKEMLLTLFRTPSVIAGITADKTAWTSSDNRGKPLGFDGASDSPYLPLRSYQWTTPSPEAGISAPPPLSLFFQLSPNRPEIRGEQITTLRRSPRDLWEISFDALWDISNGECNTVSFLWDSRCSSVLSVEPQMPYSIQHGDGQPVLTLFPSHPLSGKQHIQIKAAFDTSGTSLSVPRIVLQTENTPKTEISRYLILPRYADESVIPWNHTLLAQADAETQEYLKSITETSDSDFFFLHALGSNYSANIIREKNRSVSNFFDIAFFVQKDGTLYGTATIDLKTLGQDNFTLYLPLGYELIQFSSGSISKGIKVSENRWKFDLWNGDYPHRLHIIFRSTVPKTKKELNVFPVALKLPVLEGVSVLQTVWTVSFASYPGQSFSPFFVSSVKENLFGLPAVASSQELSGETVTELGRYTPVAEIYSVPAQLKLNLIRLDNLLKILDTFSASSAAFKTEDGKHWLSLWSKEWNRIEKNVEEQSPVFSSVVSADTAPILLDSGGKNAEELLSEYIWTILESTNLSPPFQALKQNYLNKTAEKLGREEITAGTPLLVPDASFYGLEGNYNIFGVSEGEVKELRLHPLPNTSLWTFGFSGTLLFWIALPLFLLLLSRKNLLTDSFLQFPHFWGTAAGLLFWSFCPPGLIGQTILLLTLLSFLYPAWKKRRVINNG